MATALPVTAKGRSDIPHGMDLLNRQGLNKGTAFTEDERKEFGLNGLLPPFVETLEEQVVRAYEAYKRKDDDLERHIYPIAQCNNVYIFPAIGLGVVDSHARRVTGPMFLAAARALAGNSPALKDSSASLLPPLTDLRRVAAEIAVAVGIEAQRDGVAATMSEQELRQQVLDTQWTPAYTTL